MPTAGNRNPPQFSLEDSRASSFQILPKCRSHLEANQELEQITPQLRAYPDVLGIRWQVYARAGKWCVCADLADAVIKQQPYRLAAWIDRATAMRRSEGGGLKAAYDALLPALEITAASVVEAGGAPRSGGQVRDRFGILTCGPAGL